MTLYINGRTSVHTASGGVVTTTSINRAGLLRKPVPYINKAYSKDAVNTAKSVFVNGHPLCHQQSYFSRSSGDEAGIYGGVHSGTVNGRATFLTASPNVFIEGRAAVRARDIMVSNSGNTNTAPLEQQANQESESNQSLPDDAQTTAGSYYLNIEMNHNRHIIESVILSDS